LTDTLLVSNSGRNWGRSVSKMTSCELDSGTTLLVETEFVSFVTTFTLAQMWLWVNKLISCSHPHSV